MKNSIQICLALLALACARFSTAGEVTPPPNNPQITFKSDKDKASFMFGSQLGTAFARFGVELDLVALEKSAREALAGTPSKFSDADNKQIMKNFFAYIQKKATPGSAVLAPDDKAKASYMFGQTLGGSISDMADDLNIDLFFKTYVTCANGGKINANMAEITPAAQTYMESNKPKALERMCAKNKKLGAEYLEQNKKKDGVVVTASGLQYRILKEGKGPKPVVPSRVLAHFRGTFINGAVFHDTHERGTPAKFAIDGVIDGWLEALKLMPEGSVWELCVPSDLAYGDRGSPGIPPGSTLLYELELVKASVPNDEKKPTEDKPAK